MKNNGKQRINDMLGGFLMACGLMLGATIINKIMFTGQIVNIMCVNELVYYTSTGNKLTQYFVKGEPVKCKMQDGGLLLVQE